MKTRAAVAFEAGQPLEITELDLAGPQAGEVLVEIKATGICHTDEFTLSGADPEGLFPAVLGHEGAGIVREIGAGVTSVSVDDHVIRSTRLNAGNVICLHPKTNLCQAIRTTQGQGLMPDGTSRFSHKGLRYIIIWEPRPFLISRFCLKLRLRVSTRPRLLIRFAISAAV
ncbi:MAG: hypothetical protein CM15mP119_0670 [Alphaproteobacteria bacterium]|nr:MAG: hypothetical protein CM15mP119_0670 [Alphaproteobacteria bacterium]